MVRIGAGDTSGSTSDGTDDPTNDAGSDTSVDDRMYDIIEQDTVVTEPVPEPEQPARGREEPEFFDPVPEPQQPARGRGDEGSGTESETGGFDETGMVSDQTAADINRRISRFRGNIQEQQQQFQDRQVSQQMDEGVGLANREISRARGNFRESQQEQFGDYDLSFGTNTITDEEAQREAVEEYNQAVETATGEGGIFGESIIASGLEYAGYDQAAETVETTGRDVLGGALSILNPAAVAVTATELGEYGIYSAEEIAEGDFDDLVSDTKEAGIERTKALVDYAQDNPAEVAGMGAGALLGSAAIMGGASRISSRAGTATRYAIQPGEEIAGSAGFRATKALRGEASAQRYFPNKEPLIFSEEAAIRTAKSAKAKAAELEYQDAATRAQPSRLAREMKSTRFKLEEALRSDAPTRMESDINTKYLDRLTEEYTGAKFKAAELVSDEMPLRPRGDRGQLGAGLKTKSKTKGEMADADLSSDLDTSVRQVETETGRADQRLEQAQESEVLGRSEFDVPKMETSIFEASQSDTLLDQAQEPWARVDTETGPLSDIESTPFEIETELENEVGQELELEQELNLEQELEMEQELEQELETELEFETETRREVEMFDQRKGKRKDEEDLFAPGEFSEKFESQVASPSDVLSKNYSDEILDFD